MFSLLLIIYDLLTQIRANVLRRSSLLKVTINPLDTGYTLWCDWRFKPDTYTILQCDSNGKLSQTETL